MQTKNLPKLIVRITIIYITILFIVTFAQNLFFNKDYISYFYIPLLEFCLCIFVSTQDVYHCKFLKYLAWAIFISDTLTRLNNAYNFIPLGYWCLLPSIILCFGISITLILSIKHFMRITILSIKQNKILWNYNRKNEMYKKIKRNVQFCSLLQK